MRKWLWMLLPVLLFCGCGAQQVLETVDDELLQPVMSQADQIVVNLPLDATVTAMQTNEEGVLYFCQGYTVQLSTVSGGDLNKTLREYTGYSKDQLRLLTSFKGEAKRYDCAWVAAGEAEAQVCRACILDDGSYHYVLSVMAPESEAGALQQTWNDIFESFRLAQPSEPINTGS